MTKTDLTIIIVTNSIYIGFMVTCLGVLIRKERGR